jgi:hypothetical protein
MRGKINGEETNLVKKVKEVSRAQLRERILKQAMGEIDKVLAWYEEHPDSTLREMEEQLEKIRLKILSQAIEGIVEMRSSGYEIEKVDCPRCGREMEYKGEKKRDKMTTVGEMSYARSHHWCASCEEGFFPCGQSVAGGQQPLE